MEKGNEKFGIEETRSKGTQTSSKLLKFVVVFFVLCTIGLAIALAVIVTQHQAELDHIAASAAPSIKEEICSTPGCVKAAGMILESLDETIDPCEDFHLFSCGNWIKRNIIPEDKSSYTGFSKLRDDVGVLLKALLEEPTVSGDPLAVVESKDMYAACFDEKTIDSLGVKPLLDLLSEKFGGWPMIDSNWNEADFDLIDTLVKLRLLNNKYLVSIFVGTDYKNSSNNILQFSQPGFGLPSREYFLQPEYAKELQAYKEFMIDIATHLNGNSSTIEQDAADIIEFETYLANISQTKAQRRDPSANYFKLTVGELSSNISSEFEWKKLINAVFSHVNYTFNDSDYLVVHAREFFTNMAEKVKNTPKRTLANYVLWRFTANRLSNLPKATQDISKKFNKVVYGVSAEPPRWRKCVDYTSSIMGMAVGRQFVSQHFQKTAKESALEMIVGVRQSFDELLESVPWMNERTRKVAKEKSAAIREKIGYPVWMYNDTKLNSEYEGLLGTLQPDQYLENVLRFLRFTSLKNFKEIRKPVDKNKFPVDPAVVNAYYQGTENQISFPAGILQPPFWQQDRPKSLNYGAIGTVIGHEITHGFDDTGRQFDKNGNLAEWWDEEVINNFNKAKQCIIDQYGNYTVPQLNNKHLNGQNTQGENIADNGGIKQSYRAFLRWQRKYGEEPRLPGLQQYSQNQLFFIGYSQIWCSAFRDQAFNIAIEEGSHAPGMFRIIGALSNFEEFSKEFQCPVGSKMNPVNKCSIW